MERNRLQDLASSYSPPNNYEEVRAECTALSSMGKWTHTVQTKHLGPEDIDHIMTQMMVGGVFVYHEDNSLHLSWKPDNLS